MFRSLQTSHRRGLGGERSEQPAAGTACSSGRTCPLPPALHGGCRIASLCSGLRAPLVRRHLQRRDGRRASKRLSLSRAGEEGGGAEKRRGSGAAQSRSTVSAAAPAPSRAVLRPSIPGRGYGWLRSCPRPASCPAPTGAPAAAAACGAGRAAGGRRDGGAK